MQQFDYIVIGAGSAGCVLANRLSSGSASVLLLEAGGSNCSPLIDMPKGVAKLSTSRQYAWQFRVTQPREQSDTTQESWVRGKGLGGSSAINGMIYSKGHPLDYEEWNAEAGGGWGWAEMRRAYAGIEDHELYPSSTDGGPLHISPGKFRYEVAEAMICAGEQLGVQRRSDLNSEELDGVGYYSHTIRAGRRASAARAFLDPARGRPNLTVVTNTVADRIFFDERRAVSVECRKRGRKVHFGVRREVVVACGAILSPKLLQLSGIGPASVLRPLGIDLLYDSPEVGRRMREHVAFYIAHWMSNARGLNWRFHGIGLGLGVLQYYTLHSGPMATGPYEVGAFVRTRPSVDRPDLQLSLGAFTRAGPSASIADRWTKEHAYKPDRKPGLTIHGMLIRPTSEGWIAVTSRDPDAALEIAPNWLRSDYDKESAVLMVKLMRRYLRQPALAKYVGEERNPGPRVQKDEEILAAVRDTLTSGLHAVGTCAMGRDESAVLDNRLKVRGVRGVRVVDCSAMPGLVSGNTNGPAMAFAWRAAELILRG